MGKAVEAFRSLPEAQQGAFSGVVPYEIESDRRWAASLLPTVRIQG